MGRQISKHSIKPPSGTALWQPRANGGLLSWTVAVPHCVLADIPVNLILQKAKLFFDSITRLGDGKLERRRCRLQSLQLCQRVIS